MTSAALRSLLLLCLALTTSALQLSASRARPSALRPRHVGLRMQEAPPPTEQPAAGAPQELSTEVLKQAAATASEPGITGTTPSPVAEAKDEFDWRIILYVGVPALVLGAQLFFTFSRDAFIGDVDLSGPANMDLDPPGFMRPK